jgi:2-polyprenyl-6-methoxyphenol hydroxylase-like FAD-dependent oxidoreductase
METVAMIGGGIGGLTAAIALQRRGVEARVYEAAPELLEVGAGIWLPPNAMQVFDRLGLAAAIRAGGYPIECIELADSRAGLLKALDLRGLAGRFGHPIIGIERAVLQRILAEALAPETLRLGCEFMGYFEDPSGWVRTDFQLLRSAAPRYPAQ